MRKQLRLHWAEFYEAEGQLEKALAVYEALLEEQDNPEISRKTFLLARLEYAAGAPEMRPSALVRTCLHMQVRFTPEVG